MLNSFSILIYILPLVYVGAKVVRYVGGAIQARHFASSQPIPSVFVYNQRGSVYFWLSSPWFAPFLESLPFRMGHWVKYVKKDFAWDHKGELHRRELGSDVYWTVGPGGPNLAVADAELITEICHRWKDFSKQVENYATLEVFGPSIIGAEGATWQRHRKITAPPFNERNSSLVFAESIAEGNSMLHSFTHDTEDKLTSKGEEPVVEDLNHWTMTAALYVLSGAAFNLKMTWPTYSVLSSEASELVSPAPAASAEHKLSFQQSLDFLDLLGFVILLPKWVMRYSPFRGMRHLLTCTEEFVLYVKELISSAEVNDSKSDLLSAIVRAGKSEGEKMGLSESETIGNMFLFIVAGHETSSNALHTALLMLACEPNIQTQVQEELDAIWVDKKEGDDWCYETDYPRMRHIIAVVLETLRLFPPVVNFPKHTTASPQTLIYHPSPSYSPYFSSPDPVPINLPPYTEVSIDVVSTHRNPRYYPNPHAFLPSRWLVSNDYVPPPNTSNEAPGIEGMWQPPKGAFIAFSAGFRACLGRKFALVEIAAVLGALLRETRVELVQEGGETWEEAREKALRAIDDRRTGLAMRMRTKVKVRFVRRSGKEAKV